MRPFNRHNDTQLSRAEPGTPGAPRLSVALDTQTT